MIDAFSKAIRDREAKLPNDIINTGGRFDAYRSNYFSRLIVVLGDLFEVTERLVGAEFFEALVHDYGIWFPPTSPFLPAYGKNFAGFLEQHEAVHQIPYLPDVARLEWARAVARRTDAPVPVRLSTEEEILQALQRIPALSAGASLIQSLYPVGAIWAQHQRENPEPIADWTGETLAIWQSHGETHQLVLQDQDLKVFAVVEADTPFMASLQNFTDEKQATAMIGAFTKFLNTGLLTLYDPRHGDISK